MVLEVRVIVYGGLIVALTVEKLLDNVETLLKVTIAVGRWMVSAGQTSREHVGVRLMVYPATWPTDTGGKVVIVRVPVKTEIRGERVRKILCFNCTYAPLMEVPPPRRHPAKTVMSLHHHQGSGSVNIDSNNPGISNLVSCEENVRLHRTGTYSTYVGALSPRRIISSAGLAS